MERLVLGTSIKWRFYVLVSRFPDSTVCFSEAYKSLECQTCLQVDMIMAM